MSAARSEPAKLVFVLGCQRSGTTWLANAFDASPDTWFFMEPFSPDEAIFPEWPPSVRFCERADEGLAALLRERFASRVVGGKTLLASGPDCGPAAAALDRLLFAAIQHARGAAPTKWREAARRYRLLNLNRTDAHAPTTTKRPDPVAWVVKELRLAGQIPTLRAAFPNAHFATLVRHPCATVHSIENWFAKGRLVELRADLRSYVERLREQPIGRDYKDLLDRCDGDLVRTIAAYWRISYERILRGLEDEADAQLVVYERLAERPLEVGRQVIERAGIPWSDPIEAYLRRSTRGDVGDARGITTVRHSQRNATAWTKTISPETRAKVLEMTEDSELMEHFAKR